MDEMNLIDLMMDEFFLIISRTTGYNGGREFMAGLNKLLSVHQLKSCNPKLVKVFVQIVTDIKE